MSTFEECKLVDDFYGLFEFSAADKNCKSDTGNSLNLVIVKRSRGSDVVVGKKEFSWPDCSKPETIKYDSDNGVLVMESPSYVGELSLKLPKDGIAVGKKDREPVKIFEGFSKELVEVSETPFIVQKLRKVLNHKEKINWDELNKGFQEFLNSSTLLIDPLSDEEQDRLIDLILKNHKKGLPILKAALHGNFLSIENYSKLLEKLSDSKDLEILELLVCESSSSLTNKAFTKLIKFSVEMNDDSGFEFFKKLLSKGFGSNMLAAELDEHLSVDDAVKLLNWLICMPFNKNQDSSFGNLIEFASILLDSHFHKFVWDDSCHDLLRRFYIWTQSWISLAESFTSFKESSEIMKALSTHMEDLLNYNTGYTISKVTLSCTPLC
uniref:Uncharacterized protein n=1 Tax=Strongyloides papillosus TaxID=174720 RepID=A0A0N5C1I9_STREA